MKENPRKKQRLKRKSLGLRAWGCGFYSAQILQTNPLTTPAPTQTCPSATADATGDFIFFGTSLPKKGGRGGVGARAAAAEKSAAAAAAAATARQGQNEINTLMALNRFLTCEVVVF